MAQRITSTTLQVVSGSAALASTTRTPSQPVQQAQAALVHVAREWAKIGDKNQQGWNKAAGEWGPQMGLPVDGFSCYKSLGLTRMHMGLEPSPIAPALVDTLHEVPDFSVTGVLSGAGVFNLRIVSPAATGPFLVAATSSKSKGTSRFSTGQYRILEVDDNLAATGTNITASFMDVFLLTPPIGAKISVQITPLTPNGFRGTIRYNYCVVSEPPALEVNE